MSHPAILLPGIVLPAELAYPGLIEALGEGVEAHAKELEVYATEEPPPGYGFDTEIEGVLREAAAAGFERFHLVGYSGGGAIATVFAARHPERVLSLALLEPAWVGNDEQTESELAVRAELETIKGLPPEKMMPRFVRTQLAPGVEPPPPPTSTPPWMAQRPAGIEALVSAFEREALDLDALRRFQPPVYYALGGLSNPGSFGAMAARLGDLFSDYTLDVFEQRHHFDPPHRVEPERLAVALLAVWERAAGPDPE